MNDGTANVDCRLAYLFLKELSSLQVHSDFAIKIHLDVNDEMNHIQAKSINLSDRNRYDAFHRRAII